MALQATDTQVCIPCGLLSGVGSAASAISEVTAVRRRYEILNEVSLVPHDPPNGRIPCLSDDPEITAVVSRFGRQSGS